VPRSSPSRRCGRCRTGPCARAAGGRWPGRCLSPNAHLILHQGLPDAPVARVVAWILLALLVVFPDAVCIASAQSLARAGLPARWARATALALAGVAVLVAPFGTIVAGCGLVGACY
jgi:hypothetical protein